MLFFVFVGIAVVCAIPLLLMIVSLIRDQDFRRDLVSTEGGAELFGVVRVEGVTFLLLTAFFVAGLLTPVWGTSLLISPVSQLIKRLNLPVSDPDDVIDFVADLRRRAVSGDSTSLLDTIRNLPAESQLSDDIRGIVTARKGPWAEFSNSQELDVSVPGGIDHGFAAACTDRRGQRLELIGDEERAGEISVSQATVDVTVNEVIYSADDYCEKHLQYDLKISCRDALALFSDQILSCDAAQNPSWTPGYENRKLPVQGTYRIQQEADDTD